jgi:hypothetical protein
LHIEGTLLEELHLVGLAEGLAGIYLISIEVDGGHAERIDRLRDKVLRGVGRSEHVPAAHAFLHFGLGAKLASGHEGNNFICVNDLFLHSHLFETI